MYPITKIPWKQTSPINGFQSLSTCSIYVCMTIVLFLYGTILKSGVQGYVWNVPWSFWPGLASTWGNDPMLLCKSDQWQMPMVTMLTWLYSYGLIENKASMVPWKAIKISLLDKYTWLELLQNQRTNGPVNAHLISGPTTSTKTSLAKFVIVLK